MFKKLLQKIYDNFKDNPDNMLTITSCLGWALSSAAQIFSIKHDPHRTNEEKKFLIPQEVGEAIFNVGALFLITKASSKFVGSLFETGKWVPKNVREVLNKKSGEFKHKVGTVDFSVSDVIKDNKKCLESFNTYKTFGKTIATVIGAIVSTNIVTPIARNCIASKYQNNYKQKNTMEKEALKNNTPEQINTVPKPSFKAVNTPVAYSYGLKI